MSLRELITMGRPAISPAAASGAGATWMAIPEAVYLRHLDRMIAELLSSSSE